SGERFTHREDDAPRLGRHSGRDILCPGGRRGIQRRMDAPDSRWKNCFCSGTVCRGSSWRLTAPMSLRVISGHHASLRMTPAFPPSAVTALWSENQASGEFQLRLEILCILSIEPVDVLAMLEMPGQFPDWSHEGRVVAIRTNPDPLARMESRRGG